MKGEVLADFPRRFLYEVPPEHFNIPGASSSVLNGTRTCAYVSQRSFFIPRSAATCRRSSSGSLCRLPPTDIMRFSAVRYVVNTS